MLHFFFAYKSYETKLTNEVFNFKGGMKKKPKGIWRNLNRKKSLNLKKGYLNQSEVMGL